MHLKNVHKTVPLSPPHVTVRGEMQLVPPSYTYVRTYLLLVSVSLILSSCNCNNDEDWQPPATEIPIILRRQILQVQISFLQFICHAFNWRTAILSLHRIIPRIVVFCLVLFSYTHLRRRQRRSKCYNTAYLSIYLSIYLYSVSILMLIGRIAMKRAHIAI